MSPRRTFRPSGKGVSGDAVLDDDAGGLDVDPDGEQARVAHRIAFEIGGRHADVAGLVDPVEHHPLGAAGLDVNTLEVEQAGRLAAAQRLADVLRAFDKGIEGGRIGTLRHHQRHGVGKAAVLVEAEVGRHVQHHAAFTVAPFGFFFGLYLGIAAGQGIGLVEGASTASAQGQHAAPPNARATRQYRRTRRRAGGFATNADHQHAPIAPLQFFSMAGRPGLGPARCGGIRPSLPGTRLPPVPGPLGMKRELYLIIPSRKFMILPGFAAVHNCVKRGRIAYRARNIFAIL